MRKPVCYIVGAGPFCKQGPQPQAGDLLIAADGGYEHIKRWGLRADLVIGDFDSGAAPSHPHVIRLPREKDETDMLAALGQGRARGYSCFHLYGGLGGMLDHTLANLQLLCAMAQAGEQGFLLDDEIAVTAIENGSFALPAGLQGRVSIFAQGGPAQGVTLRGLKYPLADGTLAATFPLGVSNETTGGPAEITVRSGRLLILFPRALSARL